jgi:hypothetical protein
MLANSPPLPLVIYWGNPGTLDTEESVKNIHLALRHRDRVRRIKLRLSESSLKDVFASMEGDFPALETFQLYCSSTSNFDAKLPSTFRAPNIRDLQMSDLTLLAPEQPSPFLSSSASIVSLSLEEITSDLSPERLVEHLSLIPNLKILKISLVGRVSTARARSTLNTVLEELQYHGNTDYFEALAALISAPLLKKLSISFTNNFTKIISNLITSEPTPEPHYSYHPPPSPVTFRYLPTLISEATDLRFHFARVRCRDGCSIAMDHNELWTGRAAFELKFNLGRYEAAGDLKLAGQICCLLAPMPSTVQSLLIEDGINIGYDLRIPHKAWYDLFRPFDNVKTLRIAGRFVDGLNKSLQPDGNEGTTVPTLLPRLEELVRYGSDNEFAAFVETRRVAGSPVRVVSGPKDCLTAF